MKKNNVSWVVGILLFLTVNGCGPHGGKPERKTPHPDWGRFLSMHTTGLVSRKSKIVVRFTEDFFDKDRVGQEAKNIFITNPSVKGLCVISAPNEITLIPNENLSPRSFYKGQVRNKSLPFVPDNIGDYEFLFQVCERSLDVQTSELTTEKNTFELAGVVNTSDAESPSDVEKVLSAREKGMVLPVRWTHDTDARNHAFVIENIPREDDPQTLSLDWDGTPAGITGKGNKTLTIPGKNVFELTSVQAVQGNPSYLALFFSDDLDPQQNLKGLIRTTQKPFTWKVEGNVVKIFSEEPRAASVTVTVEKGVRSRHGLVLNNPIKKQVGFAGRNPSVRFSGNGTILPDGKTLTVSLETVNVNAVEITAFLIRDDKVPQFLQTNKLDGNEELGRVGRSLWRKTISLPSALPDQGQTYALDVTSLMQKAPGGVYRLTASIRREHSLYPCSEEDNNVPIPSPKPLKNMEENQWVDVSGWDGIQYYYNQDEGYERFWEERKNPCKDAYYQSNENTHSSRNFLASNLGLTAKRDATGQWLVVATDLRTAQPLSGVSVSFRNFQNQERFQGVTDDQGFFKTKFSENLFFVAAEKNGQRGYLKLNNGNALPMSSFDTGGETIQDGLKGTLYGERDVWRPGDTLHLTFVLEDKNDIIPGDHPASLKVFNPRSQLVFSQTNNHPVGDFYRFDVKTNEEDPTGPWTAEVTLGNNVFRKTLKVETVVPNRLKMNLDLGEDVVKGPRFSGTLGAQWLHGGSAAGLKTDVKLTLTEGVARFTRFQNYVFSDPTRTVKSEVLPVFQGTLDAQGQVKFSSEVTETNAPGFLTAHFKTRVFENNGAFSVANLSLPFSPYSRYVGFQLPKGDAVRNMLLTDKTHEVSLAVLNAQGNPVANAPIDVTLYKAAWRWWWNQASSSAEADYTSGPYNNPLSTGTVTTDKKGKTSWNFMVKYPDWGRYLVRACDAGKGPDEGHCASQYVYIDWPGWAGRAQEQSGAGANALYFFSDKTSYQVGDTAVITLPDASEGRGLLTLENGSRLLEHRWIKFTPGKTKIEIPITGAMTPNVYTSISLLQPHEKNNDLPLRLYGVLSLNVTDPKTVLNPIITAPNEWAPRQKVTVKIAEAQGRPFTYTLAVVDEGLLGLTGYKTPDLHKIFYKKEALGVKTWDLFDDVVGAYGAERGRLLAIGGSDALDSLEKESDARRFPPVVEVLGPFALARGETQTKTISLPAYLGQVRVMVVAGAKGGAYGQAEKSVYVREPLALLVTAPRLVGPGEEMTIPVSVFVTTTAVKTAWVSLETDDRFEVLGKSVIEKSFTQPGEETLFFKVKSLNRTGPGRLSFKATGGGCTTKSEIHLTVRSPNPSTVNVTEAFLEPGKEGTLPVKLHGLPGTNHVSLELSVLPPLNLEKRLEFLIQYPHGCLEQTVSSVFPQLYLPHLVKLAKPDSDNVEKNVAAGVAKLRNFQATNGGFYYWPGAMDGVPNDWATTYAGHFLLEAERLGHGVPADMKANWVKYQKDKTQAWDGTSPSNFMEQAYRLYTLALARQPDLGAMNRLRETQNLPAPAQILLAAAYQGAGVEETAQDLVRGASQKTTAYENDGETFGGEFRDQALSLTCFVDLKRNDLGADLAKKISGRLVSEQWYSTQETAFALMALSRFYTSGTEANDWTFTWKTEGTPYKTVSPEKPIFTQTIKNVPIQGTTVTIKNNGKKSVFVSLITRGVPPAGTETAAENGLTLNVSYQDIQGGSLTPEEIKQGTDFMAEVTLENKTKTTVRNIAVTQMVASGWEIQSPVWGSGSPLLSEISYRDVRDDRILTYLDMKPDTKISWKESFHASNQGLFYLPATNAEAMYNASQNARTRGRWVQVK